MIFSSIRYPPFSTNKTSDIHSIHSSDVGRVSRLLHLAQRLTKSVAGRAPYHNQEPNVRREEISKNAQVRTWIYRHVVLCKLLPVVCTVDAECA